jgi:N-acetylglutamate synthase-like GNAT family acetyltransferase
LTQIRRPITSDKQQILDFCRKTFSWGDYIHEVYDSWINEGEFVILEDDGIPIAMCHGVTYPDESMLWIEGIRVRQDYRRNGFAELLVSHLEKNAHNMGIVHANMLIESENIPSLNLATKIGYQRKSQWNYFAVESKKTSFSSLFDSVEYDELEHSKLRFVESWRWIPLTKSNFEKLNYNEQILCIKDNEKIQSLGIITDSRSFDNTLILTILFGKSYGIQKFIQHTQRLAIEKNYSKVRILTQQDEIPIASIQKKFPFYLVEKAF